MWGEVAVGDPVPPLTRTIDQADMVAYAGATWDWHRMHHDPAYLATKKLDRAVVDGQVFGALLAETVQDWLGPSAFLTSLHFRFANLVFAGETVRCEGEVSEAEPDRIGVTLRVVVLGDMPRLAVSPAGAVLVRRP